MGWVIALAVIVLLALIPLGIRAQYNAKGTFLWLTVGILRFRLIPSKKQQPKEKIPAREKDVKKSQTEKKDSGALSDFLPIFRIVWELLVDFGKKLRVKNLLVYVTMAGDDPCDLAQNYGKVCAAVAALEPQLDRFLIIKSKHIQVNFDFLESTSKIWANIDISITLGRLTVLLIRYGKRIIREYLKLKNMNKGGAVS